MRRAAIVMAVLAVVAGCTVTPTPPGAPGEPSSTRGPVVRIGEPFALAVGASTEIPDGPRVTFLRVSEDSRCPSAAVCVWMGDAAVELRFEENGRRSDATLHTRLEPRAVEHDAGTAVELVGLQPYPVQGGDIEAGAYVATLRVTRP